MLLLLPSIWSFWNFYLLQMSLNGNHLLQRILFLLFLPSRLLLLFFLPPTHLHFDSSFPIFTFLLRTTLSYCSAVGLITDKFMPSFISQTCPDLFFSTSKEESSCLAICLHPKLRTSIMQKVVTHTTAVCRPDSAALSISRLPSTTWFPRALIY